jgi:hypothetical protein
VPLRLPARRRLQLGHEGLQLVALGVRLLQLRSGLGDLRPVRLDPAAELLGLPPQVVALLLGIGQGLLQAQRALRLLLQRVRLPLPQLVAAPAIQFQVRLQLGDGQRAVAVLVL